jgi:YfiR/HmsC-like
MRIVGILLLVFIGTQATAQTTNYQVYALFVVNIAKYSSWPSSNGEFQITVLGKSKVYDELLKQNGKNFNGSVVEVRQVDEVTKIGQPNILYIADGRSSHLDDIVKSTQGKPIMIITEREGLFRRGAGFSFVVMENSTLRYDINHTDLEKRQIKISKSLSSLANQTL